MDRLEEELSKADIVICSTSALEPIITNEMMEEIMKVRRDKSIYFIDIGVPRNVEANVNLIDNVYLYNIDHLNSLVEENMGRRKMEVVQAETLVDTLAAEFYDWIQATIEGKSQGLRHGL